MLLNIPLQLQEMSGIYFIRCLATDQIYIGACVNFRQRFYNHNYELKERGRCSALKAHADIHGIDNLIFNILELTDNLKERELYYIKLLSPSLNVFLTKNNTSFIKPKNGKQKRKVEQRNSDKQLINTWDDYGQIERILGYDGSNIRKACRSGKLYNQSLWNYL
jgi:excinuclease UvrABC nuclease subunit